MTKALKRFIDILDDVGMFLLTAGCVFLSSYVAAFRAGAAVKIDFSVGRLLIALVLALLVTGVFELRGIIKVADLEKVAQIKSAKRKNIWLRIVVSIALGFAWPMILETVTKLLGLG